MGKKSADVGGGRCMIANLCYDGREHLAENLHVSHGRNRGDSRSWVIVFLGGERSLQMTRETARRLAADLMEAADA